MRTRDVVLIILTTAITCTGLRAATTSVGVTISDGELKSFHMAVGTYYKAPEKTVVYVRGRGIPDEELPVVFHIAHHAHVEPEKIIALRLGGMSWANISLRFGLNAGVFYVPLEGPVGPPFGNAYGYYRKHPRSQWGKIVLADADIVNLVHLKFSVDHYGMTPAEVFKLRAGHKHFLSVHPQAHKHKLARIKVKAAQKRPAVRVQQHKRSIRVQGGGGGGRGKGRGR